MGSIGPDQVVDYSGQGRVISVVEDLQHLFKRYHFSTVKYHIPSPNSGLLAWDDEAGGGRWRRLWIIIYNSINHHVFHELFGLTLLVQQLFKTGHS